MAGIHDGHRDRIKRTFRKNGLANMEPHNALEIILTYSIPRRDVNELAHRLLREFGGFDKVLEADFEQLVAVDGVGENTATHLKLILETFQYYELQKHREGFYAVSTSVAIEYAQALFRGETYEINYLMCFDSSLKLLRCAKISEGSVNAVSVSVRRVVEIATAAKAMTVILTHNHPGGLATPSSEDLVTTKKIINALNTVGIALSDHIVVGDTFAISMAESGVIHNIKEELGI
jgi:DNA repair protein radc